MTLAQIIPILLITTIVLTVFSFGLGLRREDTRFLVRNPGRFGASLLAMQVLTPLLAALLVAAFDLHPAVKVALVTLSVSPVSPLLPGKQRKAGGRVSYATGLFAATALFSVFTVPVSLGVMEAAVGSLPHVPAGAVAQPVLLTVLAPLLLGFGMRLFAAEFADLLVRPIALVARVSLVACAIPLVIALWPTMGALIGNGTLLAIVGFATVALLIGHLLGGSEPEDRVVLALANASRHPGVAIAVAGLVAPELPDATAAILLYLLVSTIAGSVYVRLAGRARAQERYPARLRSTSPAPVGRWSNGR